MKKTIYISIANFLLLICSLSKAQAQNVGINGSGATAHASALLDLDDVAGGNNKGLLIPRIPLTAINVATPVTSPALSLLVYNTASASTGTNAVSPGYYYWDGAKWVRFAYNASGSFGEAWTTLGNAGTNSTINFIGTTDNVDLVFRTNNLEKMRVTSTGSVGIGISTPTANLHVYVANGFAGTVLPFRSGITVDIIPQSSNGYSIFKGTGGSLLASGLVYGLNLDLNPTGTTVGTKYGVYVNNETANYFSSMVGIGTPNPANMLSVSGTSLNPTVAVFNINGTGGQNTTIDLRSNGITGLRFTHLNNAFLDAMIDHNYSLANSLIFALRGNEKMRILENGNVGINTITPANKLEITQGTAGNSGLRFTNLPNASALSTNALGDVIPATASTAINNGVYWGVLGNAGTNPTTNFLGTTDNQDLVFRRNNTQAGLINNALQATSFGVNALNPSQTGTSNSAFGVQALLANTTGGQNSAFGVTALSSNLIGIRNTAIGVASLRDNTSGSGNVAIGVVALSKNTTASDNIAIGVASLGENTTGLRNVALGTTASFSNTIGNGNTSLGYNALASNQIGSDNTAIGIDAGSNNLNTNNSRNTFLGAYADATVGTFTNATAIGYNAKVGQSNALVLGGTGADAVNVGIGENNPTRTLDVTGNAIFKNTIGPNFRITNTALTNFAEFQINNRALELGSGQFFINRGVNTLLNINAGGGDMNIGDLYFSGSKLQVTDADPTNTEQFISSFIRMRSDATAPSSAMTGAISFNAEGFTNGMVAPTGALKFGWENNQTNDLTDRDGYLAFHTVQDNGPSLGGNEKLRITSNGDVGIGTTTPGDKLSVNGRGEFITTIADHGVRVKADGTNAHGILQFTDALASIQWASIMSTSTGGGDLIFNTNLTPQMIFTGAGRLGIGTLAPVHRLHVVGVSYVDGKSIAERSGVSNPMFEAIKTDAGAGTMMNFIVNGSSVGNITTSGVAIAYNTTSDIRLKENIKLSSKGINDVMKIAVKDYNYKADETKKTETGFIAQELYEIYPQAVHKGGEDIKTNPWMVDYSKLTPLLVKGMQEQQQLIEKLNTQNEALLKRIEALEKK